MHTCTIAAAATIAATAVLGCPAPVAAEQPPEAYTSVLDGNQISNQVTVPISIAGNILGGSILGGIGR